MARILAFAGSTRKESLNQKLLNNIVALLQKNSGHQVTHLRLSDYDLPLYNGDLEEASGIPESGKRLRKVFSEHDALVIVSPEYNGFFPPLIKNVLDWVSRPASGEPGLVFFKDKLALIFSASPGAMGGIRCLSNLRALLTNLLVTVHPEQFGLAQASEAFAGDGTLKDSKQVERIEGLLRSWLPILTKLKGE